MNVYFNWLGTWLLLNDSDSINGDAPSHFVEELLPDYSSNNGIVQINHNNQIYYVHYSNLSYN